MNNKKEGENIEKGINIPRGMGRPRAGRSSKYIIKSIEGNGF